MALHINDIISVLGLNQKTHSQLERIILEYGSLVQKINNPELQSWYFKTGIESNLLRVKRLKSEFEDIQSYFNSRTIDQLIKSYNKNNDAIKLVQITSHSAIFKGIVMGSLYSKKSYIEEILTFKSRIEEIKEIDYYLNNQESLIMLLGWKAL